MSTIVSLLEILYPLLYLEYKLLVSLNASSFMNSKLQIAERAMVKIGSKYYTGYEDKWTETEEW